MNNHLSNETSPYLLQHAENPVNWYAWKPEAFEQAKADDKPIFLSIGYSTCHWCHVMAHESFEDSKTAALLNQYFISIKVDREERPDIDSVYMAVCQAFTGSGGWPMSIFMTWDKRPFFAGTYFPPDSRYGMPSFTELLTAIAAQWKQDREKLIQSAGQIISRLTASRSGHAGADTDGNGQLIQNAFQSLSNSFDSKNGGFGSAPKFPAAHNLLFLMLFSKLAQNASALEMAEKTLTQMRKGGIFDQIGYGFSRYSTDSYFLAPHFEKMLYDNALLTMAYTAGFCATGKDFYLDTARKTAEYIIREMSASDGGFYSAQDADSDGAEGKFYTFTLPELKEVLGDKKGNLFAEAFDITAGGNFEGKNIPNLLKQKQPDSSLLLKETTQAFQEEIGKLYHYRKDRSKLHLDDKILTGWNSLMAIAFSMLYRACGEQRYLEKAQKNQAFIQNHLCRGSQIYASWREGKHSDHGFLDDYAFYTAALIELYSSTLEHEYLQDAEIFCAETVKRFGDSVNGGFYLCERGSSELFMNPKETYDGAMPSGNSVMAYNLVRLYHLTEKESYHALAKKQLSFLAEYAQDYPAGHCMFLLAKLIYENPPAHITVVLKPEENIPSLVKRIPFLADVSVASESTEHTLLNGETTFYICKNHSCYPPSNRIIV